MRTSIVAAGLLFAGVIAATPLSAAAAQKATAAHAPKVASATAAGTIEKFDAATHALVIKHDGKDVSFVVADGVTVKNGSKAGTVQDLGTSIGHHVKVEYAMNNGARTVSQVEIASAAKTGK